MKDKIKIIIDVIYEISLKIKHDVYKEKLYIVEEVLSNKEKERLRISELNNLNNDEILTWFENTKFDTLTSLGLARLLKAVLNNKKIECEIIAGVEDVNLTNYYINKVKIKGLWYNLDLTRNLEYFLYGIYPEILLSDEKIDYLKFDKKQLKELNFFKEYNALESYDLNSEYFMFLKNKEKVKDEVIIGLKKLEIQMEENFNSLEYKKYFSTSKLLEYRKFLKIPDEKLKNFKSRSIQIDIDKYELDLITDIKNGEIEKIIKNLDKINKIYINIDNIVDLKNNVKVYEFFKLLEKNKIAYVIIHIIQNIRYFNVDSVIESLKIIEKWKIEILKEIKQINIEKFLKLNPEIEKEEVEDFLKLKFSYIKLKTKLMPNFYNYDVFKYYIQHTNSIKRHFEIIQTIQNFKVGTFACSGFAEILNFLLNSLGVESYFVIGVNTILETGKKAETNHAWNKVKICDYWYNVDYFWDIRALDDRKIPSFLLKSDQNFMLHIPFNKKLPKAKKDFNIDAINRNFNIDEFKKYLTKKDKEKLSKIIEEQEKIIKSDRINKVFWARYEEINLTEFLSRLKKEKYINKEIYYKYILLKVENSEIQEFLNQKNLIKKYIRYIQEIQIDLNNKKEYVGDLKKFVKELLKYKYCNVFFIRIGLKDIDELNYL